MPKFGVPSTEPGWPKLVWLKKLKNSARNSRLSPRCRRECLLDIHVDVGESRHDQRPGFFGAEGVHRARQRRRRYQTSG